MNKSCYLIHFKIIFINLYIIFFNETRYNVKICNQLLPQKVLRNNAQKLHCTIEFLSNFISLPDSKTYLYYGGHKNFVSSAYCRE